MTYPTNIIYPENFKGKRQPVEPVENAKPDIRKKTRLRIKMETMEKYYLDEGLFRAKVLPFPQRSRQKKN